MHLHPSRFELKSATQFGAKPNQPTNMHLMTDPHTLSSVIYASPQSHDPWAPVTVGGWGAKTFSFDGDTRGYSGELVRSDPDSNSTPFVLSSDGWGGGDAEIHHAAELHTKDMEERQRKILGDACMVSAAAPHSVPSLGAKSNTMVLETGNAAEMYKAWRSVENYWCARADSVGGVQDGHSACPLCLEKMDPTDLSFLPCDCDYQVLLLPLSA